MHGFEYVIIAVIAIIAIMVIVMTVINKSKFSDPSDEYSASSSDSSGSSRSIDYRPSQRAVSTDPLKQEREQLPSKRFNNDTNSDGGTNYMLHRGSCRQGQESSRVSNENSSRRTVMENAKNGYDDISE
jgi:hypothetical protein